MIAIIDYEMGNLRSVQKAFEKVGAAAMITHNPDDIQKAAKIVLPGVGAMKPAMEKLESLRLTLPIRDALKGGKTFLGICLGLQLLFEESDEGGTTKGLGILPGKVNRFTSLKVPHMGWNQINIQNTPCALFSGVRNFSNVYFCHSYFVNPTDKKMTVSSTNYGTTFTSAIYQKNIYGVQFHPEKSQDIGLRILKNFTEIAA